MPRAFRGCGGWWHVVWLAFFLSFHWGEACHPGPVRQSGRFQVGAINPTGLNGKASVLSTIHPGIWGISETHLSAQGLRQFRQGLRLNQAPFTFLPGAPAPLRTGSQTSGGYTGVGFASSYPVRASPTGRHQDVWNTARVQLASFYVAPFWVQGAVVYGYPADQAKTHVLLDAVTERLVLNSRGPRFVVGDMNLLPQQLEAAHPEWCQHGFREIQAVAAARWGWQVQSTCKHATQKDHLWVSPELASMLCEVQVQHDVFADHAVLVGTFLGGQAMLSRFCWRMPQPALEPKAKVQPLSTQPAVPLDTSRPSQAYSSLWRQYEDRWSDDRSARQIEPLTEAQRGRAATLDTKLVRTAPVPMTKGRHGEAEVTFFGGDWWFGRWFKQLRRLQAYMQVACSAARSEGRAEAQANRWRAVRRAAGFKPSFAEWWLCRKVRMAGDPDRMPVNPPGAQCAQQIFQTFEACFRDLESQLKKHTRKLAQQRRVDNPSLIFRDMKPDQAEPVETLVSGTKARVQEVRADEGLVVLDGSPAWVPELPFHVGERALEVHHTEEECLWGDVASLRPNDLVRQDVLLGDLPQIFQAFAKEWIQRWIRPDHLEAHRWDGLLASFPLPQGRPMVLPPISEETWRAAARAKRSSAAIGPDGVSRDDLLRLPSDLVQGMLAIYQEAETTGKWPEQMLVGIVAALAKVPHAREVTQYRPITVLSLSYRVWGSIRARQALAYLRGVVPDTLYGNMPGRAAATIWWQLQAEVERAQAQGYVLAGAALDLQKAFNTLPRVPVLALAELVGLPAGLVRGWSGALTGVQRRFKVRGSVGPALLANAGFPEGDAMSVVAMALVDLALHHHIAAQVPLSKVISFVDDWQHLTRHPAVIPEAVQATKAFAQSWDIALDESKTKVWATTAEARKALRNQGFQTTLDARDLGGHLSFSKRVSVYTITTRIKSMQPLWPRLQLSPAPFEQKLRALSVAAWPRALHGISVVLWGDGHFDGLRSAAVRGLGAKRPGLNPAVLLGLTVYPVADPAFFALLSTFRDLRTHGSPATVGQLADPIAVGALPVGTGPVSVWLGRCNAVGLAWRPEVQMLEDSLGAFDPWATSMQEVELRLVRAWQGSIASRVQHRRGFAGLRQADPVLTRKLTAQWPAEDRALIRITLTGAFFTEDALHHIGGGDSPLCPFCDQRDGVEHRVWRCTAFNRERQQALRGSTFTFEDLPPCQSMHGWCMQPRELDVLQQELLGIPCLLCDFQVPHSAEDQIDLFTDGSCLLPREHRLRLAAWAVTVAAPVGEPAVILAAGPVPGLVQTAYRGELSAVLSALKYAQASGRRVRLWSDCLGVVRGVRGLVEGSVRLVRPTARNADLWLQVRDILWEYPDRFGGIFKVPAHEALGEDATFFEEWIRHNNDQVDGAAKQANRARPQRFWDIWDEVRRDVAYQQHVGSIVLGLHRAIGRASCRAKRKQREPADVELQVVPPVPDERSLTCPVVPERDLATVFAKFGRPYVMVLSNWLRLVTGAGGVVAARPRWVSLAQLYLAFRHATGMEIPFYRQSSKAWYSTAPGPEEMLREVPLGRRATWFLTQVKAVVKAAGGNWYTQETRPSSAILQCRLLSVYMRFPAEQLEAVESLLAARLGRECQRHDRRWAALTSL